MFAIVRTGGKQYRVAPGDKIVVEKLAGEAGDTIDITDVLLAGEGSNLKSTAGLIVGAEIVAQAKADKVTVFKKRRRHNYRRKAGHRQQLTILRIVSIGDKKAEKKAAPRQGSRSGQGRSRCCKAEEAGCRAEAAKAAKPPPRLKSPRKALKASTKDAAPAKARSQEGRSEGGCQDREEVDDGT